MRDINRIKPFLKQFEELWLKHPDIRFGQLVYWLTDNMSKRMGVEIDVFHPEDEKWLEAIRAINQLTEENKI